MKTIGLDLKLLDKVYSKVDKTVKFVFLSRGQIIEFSYINKDDGKDIICVPVQTACNLMCEFCFLSDYDLQVRNLTPKEIAPCIDYVVQDLNLLTRLNRNKVFLISFMGCGEPLLNIQNVIESCRQIRDKYQKNYQVVRFAVASLIPKMELMEKFVDSVRKNQIPLKFHLSLHSPDFKARKWLMPAASSIRESIDAVLYFMKCTNNSAEIHYALIDGVNDREEDLFKLVELLKNRNIPIKFLVYNKKPSASFIKSPRIDYFRKILEKEGIATEFYIPPGADIGSSCGQFLMDYYEKYNKK
ncbi:MAG: radical SAM protein [bacterium]|nr:radical SAM protein [bacterium]